MRRQKSQYHTQGLAALLLAGLFAACALAVLLTGAQAYSRLTQRDQAVAQRRTCAQYLATRVRQADQKDGVSVAAFGDTDALLLMEGEDYATRIYCYDGYLMELFAAKDDTLAPADGTRILPSGGLALSLEDGLLTAILTTTEGTTDTLRLSLRSGEGAAA